MKNLIVLATLGMLTTGCNSEPKTETAAGAPREPDITIYTTKTGKVITIEEAHPVGMSLSTVKIGFENDSLAPFVLNDIDPINKVMLGDLDENGYEEAYIISTSAGSGSAGSIHGFASNKDISFSEIFVPEMEKADLAKGGNFEGYGGHDVFSLEDNTITRTFPVKLEQGTRRTIKYKLKQGEASYQLYITSSIVY